MTRREIVLRAIERGGPVRVPVHHCNRDLACSDTAVIGYGPARDFVAHRQGGTEWGYVWKTFDETMGQPQGHPLADWALHETYTPPDAFAAGRFDGVRERIAAAGDRFVLFGVGISGFNQATFLRGFEAFFEDVYADRGRVERVLDIVFGFENGLIEQALGYPFDGMCFADDWGTQQGPMIQPALWREVFLPRYVAQFARIKRAGKKVWFHSCGAVFDLLGDLMEAGVDVFELLQPDLLGVERLAGAFGGKVCFCCSVDHQRRAISGTRDEIFAYANFLRHTLGAYNGGFIAYVEDYASLGMSDRNYQWIRDAFHQLEGY